MALGVSPERVREVRFAEQWRGYRTDEVDAFVEQVAEAFDQLEARLAESSARATDAERRLLERGPDEDLSRTLVLAQRTADAARREAQIEAAQLVRDAEERARLLVEETEVRRRQLDEEIESRMQAELREVVERRAMLEDEAASLASFVDHERRRLADELREQLAWLEQAGRLEPRQHPLVSPPPTPNGLASVLSVAHDERSERADAPGSPGRDALEAVVEATADARDAVAAEYLAAAHDAHDTAAHDTAAHDTAAHDTAAHDTAAHDTAAHDTAAHDLDDDMALDDLDIPWRRSDEDAGDDEGGDHHGDDHHGDDHHGDDHHGDDDVRDQARDDQVLSGDGPDGEARVDSVAPDDDPFFAELRRAVNDPEPLGPRDDASEANEWGNEGDLYDEAKSSARFRRRRQR